MTGELAISIYLGGLVLFTGFFFKKMITKEFKHYEEIMEKEGPNN